MTPTNGDGPVEEPVSLPKTGYVNGKPGGPPPEPVQVRLTPRRIASISSAVEKALGQRDSAGQAPPRQNGFSGDTLRAEFQKNPAAPPPERNRRSKSLLPPDVRKRLQADILPQVPPSRMHQGEWKTNRAQMFARLFIYTWTALKWLTELGWDKIRGRDSLERRAVRLRKSIESLGGSAVKLGQQLAMRIDLLPYEYTVELSKMLDRMTPYPVEYAIGRIEQFLRRPLGEVFKDFNPVPIGSASVACVFSAYLENGDYVAIKVRRPKIGETFVADCAALGLVLQTLEFFTFIRPGLSHNFLYDFRQMLLDELDFSKECRYTELFRRRVHKRMDFVSAPKVYPELSCEDILVTEFVGGVWLRELLNAVEQHDEPALLLLKEKGIEPELVARRLLRANQFGVFENLLFHADPHPSNVVVQEDSRLVFIDFGACGVYTSRERNIWRQFSYYHQQEDVGRMVQSAMALLEPLPPIDIDELSKRLENLFWEDLNAFKSKHTQWWERTSARVWIKYLELAREYNVPLALNTLRMIRSTLLYETIGARLYGRINAFKEHRAYLITAGKAARKRVRKRAQDLMFKGPTPDDYRTFEQMMDMGNRAMYLAQRWLDQPPFHFSMMVDKFVYAVSVVLRAMIMFVFFTLGGGFLDLLWHLVTHNQSLSWHLLSHYPFIEPFMVPIAKNVTDIWSACKEVLMWGPYQFLIGVNLFLSIRKVMMRMFDKDVKTSGMS
ncbi:MAG TPA: AarF/UbiB family protein [Bryobacteraceae bacterium]|jgi:predicted unusual protein kinase regulating ubiquinone biosynthesis (AarF/ABC1/UbiB family)|nr:AarF/UbiB family protein [Bryobacteraceae bacterium]